MTILFPLFFLPVLPLFAVAWVALAITYPRARNKKAHGKWLFRIGMAIGLLSYLSWIGYRDGENDLRRGKVARAKSEIRNTAVNLETYYIDHDAYPPAVDAEGSIVLVGSDGSGVSAGYVPWLLTTPTAYASSLPSDPFHQLGGGRLGSYRYATNGLSCWIMASNGPDGKPDIRIDEFPDVEKAACDWREFMAHFGTGDAIEYDASNGVQSAGDVVRVGP